MTVSSLPNDYRVGRAHIGPPHVHPGSDPKPRTFRQVEPVFVLAQPRGGLSLRTVLAGPAISSYDLGWPARSTAFSATRFYAVADHESVPLRGSGQEDDGAGTPAMNGLAKAGKDAAPRFEQNRAAAEVAAGDLSSEDCRHRLSFSRWAAE